MYDLEAFLKQSLQQIADLKDKQFEKDLDDIHKMHQHRIEEAINACVPKKKVWNQVAGRDGYKLTKGYNQCLSDIKNNIKKYVK